MAGRLNFTLTEEQKFDLDQIPEASEQDAEQQHEIDESN